MKEFGITKNQGLKKQFNEKLIKTNHINHKNGPGKSFAIQCIKYSNKPINLKALTALTKTPNFDPMLSSKCLQYHYHP